MLFGKKIRELRDENVVLQRQLAALLEIDTPMFSKIERGDRRAKREQVLKLAEYFHQDENEMLTLWLADKVLDAVDGEQELSSQAIEIAQKQIKELYKYGDRDFPYTPSEGRDRQKLGQGVPWHSNHHLRHCGLQNSSVDSGWK